MEQVEEKWQACGVCAFPLDRYTQDGNLLGWIHFNPPEDGHIAVPVDADQIEHRQVCDFCNEDGVAWIVPAKSFEMLPESPVSPAHMSHGAWGACVSCGHLIQRGKWSALITRVKQRGGPPVPRSALEFLYDRLQANMTEGVVPYDEWRARQTYPLPNE